jgi:hypothetical protein
VVDENQLEAGGSGVMGNLVDLAGKSFGRLVVIGRNGSDRRKQALWLCQCQCGKERTILGASLRNNRTTSCGCYLREIRAANIIRNAENHITHGKTDTPLYIVWRGMLRRCYNENHKSYENYGGRGIKVCDEWLHDFSAFYYWAMANGYSRGLTIERENNDAGYSAANCKWATPVEQSNNRRSTVRITVGDLTLSIVQHARLCGRAPSTIARRWRRGIRGAQLLVPGRIP